MLESITPALSVSYTGHQSEMRWRIADSSPGTFEVVFREVGELLRTGAPGRTITEVSFVDKTLVVKLGERIDADELSELLKAKR